MPGREIRWPTAGARAHGRVLLLAIDDEALPLKHRLCYYIAKPTVRPEPVLAPSRDNPNAADHLAAHFYGTVLHDGGKFRMWYSPHNLGAKPGTLIEDGLCYAESDDGIAWVKPSLGQVEYKGSRNNNALALPDARLVGATVIKDEDDPDPQRRYKMMYEHFPPGKYATARALTSPDGLHWSDHAELPVQDFLEQASFYKHDGLYILSGHTARGANSKGPRHYGEGGSALARQGIIWVSTDFDHWLKESADAFFLPEPRNPADRSPARAYDQNHLGVGGASFGNVCVGLYCLWHNQPAANGFWFGWELISGDFGLLVSTDGIHYREPVKGHIFLHSTDSPATPIARKPLPTILCQANGILNVGDETRIYHGRWLNGKPGPDYYAEVALATLPRDRWGALGLGPDETEGSVWTAPVTLPEGGARVSLNADEADGMRVEVADARFTLRPGWSGESAGTVAAQGGLDCVVTWPQGNLAALGGQTVRFRVHLQKQRDAAPRLYALYLDV